MKDNIQINILTSRDMERLAAFKKDRDLSVSFYLGIRADRDFLKSAHSLLSEKRKELEKNSDFGKDDIRQVEKIFADIEKNLRAIKLPKNTRTFVMFYNANGEGGMYRVPVYIPSKLSVERDWNVHPFLKKLQAYPHYAVVLLERDRGRIFNYFWGEVEDETEEIRSEVPQRMNAARATWKGLEERKIQNHIEVHINRHLKKVADMAERYMEKNKIPYMVIASHRELIGRFEEFFSTSMRKKIVGAYHTRNDQNLLNIKKRSLEVVDKFEFEKEEELIREIFDGESAKKKMAVLGAESVLRVLGDYRVHLLAIGKKYTGTGFMCADDGKVYLEKAGASCKAKPDKVEDVADELIESAIRQKVGIMHFMHEHADFDRFGVGSVLK